jgi:hypothetical protein
VGRLGAIYSTLLSVLHNERGHSRRKTSANIRQSTIYPHDGQSLHTSSARYLSSRQVREPTRLSSKLLVLFSQAFVSLCSCASIDSSLLELLPRSRARVDEARREWPKDRNNYQGISGSVPNLTAGGEIDHTHRIDTLACLTTDDRRIDRVIAKCHHREWVASPPIPLPSPPSSLRSLASQRRRRGRGASLALTSFVINTYYLSYMFGK